MYVPVVGADGKPLMPCHPARARELVRKGRALRRFDRGLFYLQLVDRKDGETQPVVVGIDPGSKWEGFTVKSGKRTFLNVHADAVTHVSRAVETRRNMRRARRYRTTPCRANRQNRARGGIPPSTKARWQWKLRLAGWLARRYPVSVFVVEDVKVKTQKGKTGEARHWNRNFSPIEVGKRLFYDELAQIAPVDTRKVEETAALREQLGLAKTADKSAEVFEAHCVDSWVLANSATGGHATPDCTRLLRVTPLRFHRRQLHRLQPAKCGVRGPYGGTRSHGFKRGALVKHYKFGMAYVGGNAGDRVSLHSVETGARLTKHARPADCVVLAPFNAWRTRLLPGMNAGVPAA